MEYMLHYGLLAHKYLIYAYIAVLFFHLAVLLKSEDGSRYRRFMLIYNPMLILPTLGGVLFSGLVLLTVNQFSFDIANSVMIVASIGLIIHEYKRAKELRLTPNAEFSHYKKRALRYLATNIFIVFVTTFIAIKFAS